MNKIKVLDLFSGMGGFSRGFSELGADCTGVDLNLHSKESYRVLTGGKFINANLHTDMIEDDAFDIIIGGPPCRPWSSINVTRRGINHPDYNLVNMFLQHVELNRPEIFIMENVPPLKGDPVYAKILEETRNMKYSVSSMKVVYSDYGANVKRSRLLLIGSKKFDVDDFLSKLRFFRSSPKTVREAIHELRDIDYGGLKDHIWPHLLTIDKYKKYYESGKYGWRILKWDEPAPSFGNVMKTYTLHPDSFQVRKETRTISVAEALRIMGYPKGFTFPSGIPMGQRYQMIVDSVSPVFSRVMARAIYNQILEDDKYASAVRQTI